MLALNMCQITLEWMDHLRKIPWVNCNVKLKLLGKACVEFNQFTARDTEGVSVLQSIKLVFEQRLCFLVYGEIGHLTFDVVFLMLYIVLPGIELCGGDLGTTSQCLLFAELSPQWYDCCHQRLIVLIMVLGCNPIQLTHLLCSRKSFLRVYGFYLEVASAD